LQVEETISVNDWTCPKLTFTESDISETAYNLRVRWL